MEWLIVSTLVTLAALMLVARIRSVLDGSARCDACTHKCEQAQPPALVQVDEPRRQAL